MQSSEKLQQRKIQDHKNQLRRENRVQVRQALLISEYVQYKYPEVYEEAANFYNQVNAYYPLKHDLRRTDHFKALKLGIPFHPKKVTRNYVKQVYQPIPVTDVNNFTPICQPIPEGDIEQTETVHSEGDAEQTETVHSEGDAEQTETVHSEGDAEQTETVHSEGDAEQTETVHPEKQHQFHQQKIMQLRIPLLKPSVITQTVQVVTDEVLEENPLQVACDEIVPESTPLYPSLHEEIPEEIIEKIINELRQDPELHNIMTEIEQVIELEQLDMDIDIPDDDRLENELENLLW